MSNQFARKDPIEARLQDTGQRAPFGQLRVASATALFDSTHQYDASPLLWEDVITGGASVTHLPNESSVRLRCATANGDKVVRQTRQYMRYQPGKGQVIRLTVLLGAATTNVRRRLGYFDGSNGIFIEQTGSGLSIVRRTFTSGSVVDNSVAQADWSEDKLDGTGASGFTLDATKALHLVIDLEWLGVGRVRVGFDQGTGEVVWAHHFISPNILTTVYMTTANLPIRLEIENTAAQGSNHDLIAMCSMVASEQGFEEEHGLPFSVGNGITAIAVTTRRPILSIRPKATFNSIVNRGTIIPESVEANAGSGSLYVEVVYNGSLTGASFASVNGSSITEFDVAATAISGGIPLVGFTANSGSALVQGGVSKSILARLPLTLDQAGANPIPLTVVATAFTGSVNTTGQINWRELR